MLRSMRASSPLEPLLDAAERLLDQRLQLREPDLDVLGVRDEVALAARAEHRGLRAAHAAQLHPQDEHQQQREERDPARGQRCDAGSRSQVIGHRRRISAPGTRAA